MTKLGQIVLHQVSKTYPGGVRGVDELNLEIGDGGFMVLVGPSGGGKSRWTARVSARSQVRPGEPVDPASLYFFDPDSGRAIGAE